MRFCLVLSLLLIASSAFATDAITELARDPSPGRQAARAGVDYAATVSRARRGDASALARLFHVTTAMDGMGATLHSSVLRLLMESLGDQQFSRALRQQPSKVRDAVTKSLDFDFRHPWQMHFPLTYSLGRHSRELLSENKNT
jgi:hypothetical protein